MTFLRLGAEELTERSAYDLVFSRYLLSHLPRPRLLPASPAFARYADSTGPSPG